MCHTIVVLCSWWPLSCLQKLPRVTRPWRLCWNQATSVMAMAHWLQWLPVLWRIGLQWHGSSLSNFWSHWHYQKPCPFNPLERRLADLEAIWKAFQPSLFLSLGLAPCWISRWMMVISALVHARCSGVLNGNETKIILNSENCKNKMFSTLEESFSKAHNFNNFWLFLTLNRCRVGIGEKEHYLCSTHTPLKALYTHYCSNSTIVLFWWD